MILSQSGEMLLDSIIKGILFLFLLPCVISENNKVVQEVADMSCMDTLKESVFTIFDEYGGTTPVCRFF